MGRGVCFSRITGLWSENYAGSRYCRAEEIGMCRVTAWKEGVEALRGERSTLPFLLLEENVGGANLEERRQWRRFCGSEKAPADRLLSCRSQGGVNEKGRNTVAPFWEPDTRQQPLPLLPFGPGGVGGATAVRFPELIKRKAV